MSVARLLGHLSGLLSATLGPVGAVVAVAVALTLAGVVLR